MEKIITERLILREAKTSRDESPFHKMLREEGDFKAYCGFDYSEDIMRNFYGYFDHGECHYSVFEKDNDAEMIGYVGIALHETGSYEAEFYISRPYRNKGYCTEALKVLIDAYFEGRLPVRDAANHQEELSFLYATFLEDNEPVRRVLGKCGFEENPERVLLCQIFIDKKTDEATGFDVDELLLTKKRWEENREI